MKKILISVSIIAAAAAVVIGATTAYFSDTETSTGNTFTAGTIDIAVDGQNPWSRTEPFHLVDMKPSQVDYTNFTIQNVGTNPVNVTKEVKNIVTDGGEARGTASSEPECYKQGGNWSNGLCIGGNEIKDIDSVIEYDLSVKVKDVSGAVKWWQMLYNKNKTVNQLTQPMFLGMIPSGWSMDVVESYHMKDTADNEYQGDKMTFNIVLTGEQLKGTLVLDNKSGDPDWMINSDDDIKGTLTYGVKDSKFNYSFTGKAKLANTKYWLIQYVDPWGTPGRTFGSAITDGSGNVPTISGSVDLGANMTNAKIWLVTDADYDETANKMVGWNLANYLFETGLIDYYDSDL